MLSPSLAAALAALTLAPVILGLPSVPSSVGPARSKRSTTAYPDNETLLQGFEWFQAGGGVYWNLMASRASSLADMGISAVWLPPPSKAYSGAVSVGYDPYDLWDLGEFNQMGTTATKWGTKDEFFAAVGALKDAGITSYVDAVLNHRMGGDATETFTVQVANATDRFLNVGGDITIEAWTKYTFAARNGAYSSLTLNHESFTAIDYDQSTGEAAIYRMADKEWCTEVSTYLGNYVSRFTVPPPFGRVSR